MMALMSSSVSHELLTPLKCIASITEIIQSKITEESQFYNLDLVLNTAQMLINQVKGNLDRNLLDANQF